MAQFLLDMTTGVLGVIIVISYTIALKYHFDMPSMPPGVQLISLMVIASTAALFTLCFRLQQPLAAQLAGLGLMITSYVLFWLTIRESKGARLHAAFDKEAPHCVLRSGPYAHVRHPFYLSYLLFWSGWGIASWNVWGAVPFIAMGTTYVLAAREEEAKFMETPLAREYREYARVTGRFVPRIWK